MDTQEIKKLQDSSFPVELEPFRELGNKIISLICEHYGDEKEGCRERYDCFIPHKCKPAAQTQKILSLFLEAVKAQTAEAVRAAKEVEKNRVIQWMWDHVYCPDGFDGGIALTEKDLDNLKSGKEAE